MNGELLVAVIGLATGLGVGASVTYSLMKRGKTPPPDAEAPPKRAVEPLNISNLVGQVELDRAKREVRTLILEKDLLGAALTKVYEAEVDGTITRQEREEISTKYREQLKGINERLSKSQSLIEVGELERLRDELLGLFNEKMAQLEARLKEAKLKVEQIRGPMPPGTPEKEGIGEEKKPETRRRAREGSEVDRRVKELKDEVLEALSRLEQIDIEG